jgi:uncharacterized repeat protein (TIGR01451 family)
MKKLNYLLFILCSTQFSFGQSISINHQFQGISPSSLSKGNHKIGWVTLDSIQGNPYTYNYMDSLQNITSFVDTNITIPFDSVVINGIIGQWTYGGDQLFVSQMDPNGHLWGLFFDWNLDNSFYDSSSVNLYIPQSCYFLYDFDNHQRHYLNVSQLAGKYLNTIANPKINILNDTIYVTIDYALGGAFGDETICIKWSNGTIISNGWLYGGFFTSSSAIMDVFFDHNSKLSSIQGNGAFGFGNILQSQGIDTIGNPISYHQFVNIPTYPNLFTETFDACVSSNSTYILGDLSDDPTDTITAQGFRFVFIMNNAFDTILPIPTGFLPLSSSICVDHLDRIWVYAGDSIFMYDGNWIGFSLQGFSPIIPATVGGYYVPEVYFIEYAENKFMISADGKGWVNPSLLRQGDGILFINYTDPTYPGLNHVQGKVFYDSNNNGTYDTGEYPIINQIVNAGAVNANVYLNGNYNLYLANGPQTVITTNVLPNLTSVPTAYNFNFSTPTDTLGINFAMQHIVPINDLRVDMTVGIHRTFQTIWHSLTFKNTGSAAANGTVTVQFDPLMSFNNSNSYPAATTSNPGNLTWDFTNLQPFETRHIYFYLGANNNFNIGDTVYTQTSITPIVGDATPANNTDSTMSIFVGAFDPNMKVVTQNGAEVNTILNDDPLEYVIHFQNVGNDTAFTVVITDTISNLLDLSSLEIIGSSHANYWGIYNRTLQFTFNSINLPDSATNQLASNGFVSYRIKPVANISMSNVINNTAAIYFDVNAPVITNNAQVTLIDVTSIKEDDASLIKVVPNPAQQIIYILGKNNQNQTATIYDAVGKVVLRSAINNNQSIDISGLSKGIYFVDVAGQRVKFVKE